MPQGKYAGVISGMAAFSKTSFTVADIFREAAVLIRRNLVLCGIGVVLLFVVKAGSDLGTLHWSEAGSRSAVFVRLVYLPFAGIVHYLLVTRLMQAEHMAERGWSADGLLRYFGVFLLTTIGMIFGVLLLIIPGLILAIRWILSINFIIGRNLGPIPAIKASWEATRGYGWKIFVVVLLLGLAMLPGIFLARGGVGIQAEISTATVIIGNIYSAIVGMIDLCVTLSIYSILVGPDHAHYSEVFT